MEVCYFPLCDNSVDPEDGWTGEPSSAALTVPIFCSVRCKRNYENLDRGDILVLSRFSDSTRTKLTTADLLRDFGWDSRRIRESLEVLAEQGYIQKESYGEKERWVCNPYEQ